MGRSQVPGNVQLARVEYSVLEFSLLEYRFLEYSLLEYSVCKQCAVCCEVLSRRSRRASFKSSRSKRVDDGYEPEESAGERGAADL